MPTLYLKIEAMIESKQTRKELIDEIQRNFPNDEVSFEVHDLDRVVLDADGAPYCRKCHGIVCGQKGGCQ